MKIYVSKDFSAAIINFPKDKMELFYDRINLLKSMNKTDITSSDDVFKLTKSDGMTFYTYHMYDSVFVIFTFKDKNTLVLLDEVELLDNEIKSLVFPLDVN